MNGRVYDPLVARFMSADPIIQDPMHSQSYNRYSYVWNNPTNLTDPTGFAAAKETATVTTTLDGVTTVNALEQVAGGCPSGSVCIQDDSGNTWEVKTTTSTNEKGATVSIDWTGGLGKDSSAKWASKTIDFNKRQINMTISMNLTTESGMSDIQGKFLTEAASASIGAFWSGSVTINDQEWSVKTTVSLSKDGIPLELRVSNTVDYKSSANPGTPGVTGFIVYNAGFKGFSRQPNDTLQDFLIVAAHETGHSILDLKKELGHSWGHKGTSYPWGAIKGSSPHFPKNGPIDLMRYYNGTMSQKDRFERMRPVEEDLLLLIGAKRY